MNTVKNDRTVPELLAPAGSDESLRAALAAGADAVYFGGTMFSNRMRAKNFTNESIGDAVKRVHDLGAKAYITINTRVRDREYDELLSLAEAVLGGARDEICDAIIIADFGAASLIKKKFPHAVLHASTQTSLSSPEDLAAISKMGFSRLVLPRELSADEIRMLCRTSQLELEMFLHGAHCVSCSGQCLMSFIMGGRSGNRGECAQPCRLPYSVTDFGGGKNPSPYPLSPADMCLAGRITDVLSLGIASLKLEGRLKPASYVYGVTKIYRTLIDEGRNADASEIRALEDLFARGFTDGYYRNSYAGMGGKQATEKFDSTSSQKELNRAIEDGLSARREAIENSKIRPITARFTALPNEPMMLTLEADGVSVVAHGEIPQAAIGSPMTESSAAKNLTKLGGTGFSLEASDISAEISDGLWVPISALNELRRRAVSELAEKIGKISHESTEISDASGNAENKENTENKHTKIDKKPTSRGGVAKKGEKIAEFAASDAILSASDAEKARIFDYFDAVFVPHSDYGEVIRHLSNEHARMLGAVLPVLLPSAEEAEEIFGKLSALGCRRVMAHTPGQIRMAEKFGMEADASFRTNVTNTAAMDHYISIGARSVTISPELPSSVAPKIGGGVIIYGRLPLMTLSRCVICGGKCKKGNIGGRVIYPRTARPHSCKGELIDRKGERFPVISNSDCVNVVYNSHPYWMADKLTSAVENDSAHLLFMFTDEDPAEIIGVIDGYIMRRARSGRRI